MDQFKAEIPRAPEGCCAGIEYVTSRGDPTVVPCHNDPDHYCHLLNVRKNEWPNARVAYGKCLATGETKDTPK